MLDEVPYLMESVEAFEGILQRAWDRQLSRKPVLLLLIGSDLSMMEALSSDDRPFHQRGTEMVVGPLNPAEIATMLDLGPAEAFDAALVTGGLPLICSEWPRGATRLVVGEVPLSTRPSKERRYRIVDPYLRFWLSFVERAMPLIERRRGDLALERVREQGTSWRGRVVEPLVRDALARLLPDGQLPAAPAVGAYWTRSKDIEVDIVGADRAPVARRLLFLGSIKWLNASFDDHDLVALQRQRSLLTDEPIPLVAASRGGVTCAGLTATYDPGDLVMAWSG